MHNTSARHNMSQWVKTTDLCFKTDSKSVIFSYGSYYVRGSYYVYHWKIYLSLTEYIFLTPLTLLFQPKLFLHYTLKHSDDKIR